jgi:hypothetical protein
LLSSSSFLARILDNEKAETLGSLEKEVSVFIGSMDAGLLSGSFSAEICTVFTVAIRSTGVCSIALVLSATE